MKRDFMTSKNSFNYFIWYRLKRHLQSFERSAGKQTAISAYLEAGYMRHSVGILYEAFSWNTIDVCSHWNFKCLSDSSLKCSVYISCRPPVICRAKLRGEEEMKYADYYTFRKDRSTALAFHCMYVANSLTQIIV